MPMTVAGSVTIHISVRDARMPSSAAHIRSSGGGGLFVEDLEGRAVALRREPGGHAEVAGHHHAVAVAADEGEERLERVVVAAEVVEHQRGDGLVVAVLLGEALEEALRAAAMAEGRDAALLIEELEQ